jgi:hypothetical protein
MTDEKEESGLSKMLTELNLADKYLHKLNSEGVVINDLRETLKHRGDSALERLLEQIGFDKALHRHRIANQGDSGNGCRRLETLHFPPSDVPRRGCPPKPSEDRNVLLVFSLPVRRDRSAQRRYCDSDWSCRHRPAGIPQ